MKHESLAELNSAAFAMYMGAPNWIVERDAKAWSCAIHVLSQKRSSVATDEYIQTYEKECNDHCAQIMNMRKYQ